MYLSQKIFRPKALIAILLSVVLLISFIPSTAVHAEGLEELEAQIDAINAEKEQASSKRKGAQQKLDELKDVKAAVIEEKMLLEERNLAAAEEIDLINQEIALYNRKIAEKKKDVEAALNRENVQLEKYRSRVRAMEESGGFNVLAIIFNSDNFSNLLAAIDDYNDVMNSDVILYDQLQAARAEHESIKAEYEGIKAECEEKEAELQAAKAELEAQIAEADELIVELEKKIKEAEEELEAMERAEAAAAAAAANFMAEYYRLKAIEQAGQQQPIPYIENGGTDTGVTQGEDTTSGTEGQTQPETTQPETTQPDITPVYTDPAITGATGAFMWPFPAHYNVTSVFGYRASTGSYHTGIDIDGYQSMGSAIVAADGGTVIKAEYYGGYGNCIIIDHGNGYSTLYAHLSSMNVGVGSSVSQGQTIGGVGNTGTCYGIDGIHLHFEIMINGSQTDPLGYLSGYTLI